MNRRCSAPIVGSDTRAISFCALIPSAPTAEGGGNECAGYFGIDITGSSSIATQTWTSVGSIGAALLTYVSTDNTSGFAVDPDTCVVSWTAEILVWVVGQLRFASDFTAGNTVAIRLEFGGSGGSTDVINTHQIPAGGANFAGSNFYFCVCATNFAATTDVQLYMYHDSASSKTFESADLSVERIAPSSALTVEFP